MLLNDTSLKHHIDNPLTLNHLPTQGLLYEAPPRTSVDVFFVSIAEKQVVLIPGNGTFKEYLGEKPRIERRRLTFRI